MGALIANYHTHLELCGHAVGMTNDYAMVAIEAGITELGISDHGPIPRSWMSDSEYTVCCLQKQMDFDVFKNVYLKDIENAQEKYKDKISIYKGVEIEYIEGHDEYYENLRTYLDYMILGQHYINLNGTYFSTYSSFDKEKAIRYTDTVCSALDTGLFKIIAHPDLYMYSYTSVNGNLYEFDEVCEACARRIISSAIKNNVYLEFNCGGVGRGLKKQYDGSLEYLYPKRRFWEIVKEYKDAKIIVGCDAHKPERLKYDVINETLDYFQKFGLKRSLSIDLKLVAEVVPNYSEGKNGRKMAEILSPFKKDNFYLIDLEMDEYYNRSVVTVIGHPLKLIERMKESTAIAKELIDLRCHSGEHLRIGAVDVCPIIPIKNLNEKEAKAYAKRLAKEINFELDIPVYLYNLSAIKEEHKLLPDIRKGEFEGLKEKMQDPIWYPDYGKNVPHESFGAMVIGCRKPLIAFNIDLDTENIKIADEISRRIRYSSGGYRGVQARSAKVDGNVQVSINITDFNQTSLYQVYEAVKMEAKRFDVNVISSELIGLIFDKAVIDTLKYYLKVPLNEKLELTFEEKCESLKKYLKIKNMSSQKIIEYHIK